MQYSVRIYAQEEQKKQSDAHKYAPQVKVPEELFPPCITLLLKGVSEDGRKRAVLILVNFLRQMKYSLEEIEQLMLDWNKKNYEPLREGYIRSQLSWYKRNPQNLLPPNCANDMYYKGIGVCKPDGLCTKIKNPIQYVKRKEFLQQLNKKGEKKTKTKHEPSQGEHESR